MVKDINFAVSLKFFKIKMEWKPTTLNHLIKMHICVTKLYHKIESRIKCKMVVLFGWSKEFREGEANIAPFVCWWHRLCLGFVSAYLCSLWLVTHVCVMCYFVYSRCSISEEIELTGLTVPCEKEKCFMTHSISEGELLKG